MLTAKKGSKVVIDGSIEMSPEEAFILNSEDEDLFPLEMSMIAELQAIDAELKSHLRENSHRKCSKKIIDNCKVIFENNCIFIPKTLRN